MLVALWLGGALLSPAVSGQDAPWQWRPSLLPKAFLIEGLWTDTYRLRQACHVAGLPYQAGYRAKVIKFDGLKEVPSTRGAFGDYAVIVLANVDAKALGDERLNIIREFVENGGGLVVLGGYWAYGGGAYQGTPLAELLPVDIPEEAAIEHQQGGLPLAPGPAWDWDVTTPFGTEPRAFYMHRLKPRDGASVRLVAGDMPVVVTQNHGKGRVVACLLTVNGDAPRGTCAFWDWPDWPRVLGCALDWAAAKRPLAVAHGLSGSNATAPTMDLFLGEKELSADEFTRLCDNVSAANAESAFRYWIDTPGTVSGGDLVRLVEALLPFVTPGWSEAINGFLSSIPVNPHDCEPALVLLGACGNPNDEPVLLKALKAPGTRAAAARGLGRGGFAAAVPPLRVTYAAALKAAESKQYPGHLDPVLFASEQAAAAAHAAQALYRLGARDAVPQVADMVERLHYYRRVFRNACKLPSWDDDVKERWAQGKRLGRLLDRLCREAGPVPQSQLSAFLSFATTVEEPVKVEWVLLAMEQSKDAYEPATWRPLCRAKDGMVARLARVLAGDEQNREETSP